MKTTLNMLSDIMRSYMLLLAAFACMAVSSCGGDDGEEDGVKKEEITTTTLLESAGDVSYSYNSDGTLKVAFDNGTSYQYSYNPEKITNSDGKFTISDIKRNSSGAITSMTMQNTGGTAYKATASYDSEGHLVKYVIGDYTETTFTWDNGKLVKFTAKGTYTTREEVDEAVFEYNGNEYKNTTGQYTYSMFECEISGTDWLFLCGSFGRAGNYLPTKVTSTENITYKNGTTKTANKEYSYSYTLNSDGTVATETSNNTTKKYVYVSL